MMDGTLWRGRPPPQTEKRTAQRGGAGSVEAPALITTERVDRTLSGVIRDECIKGGSGGSGWRVNTVKREREKKKQPEQPRKVMS
jgi:hypothetical protein